MKKLAILLSVLLVLTLVLSACGSKDEAEQAASGSSGSGSGREVIAPSFGNIELTQPSYDFTPIDVVEPTFENVTIRTPSYDFTPVEIVLPEFTPPTISITPVEHLDPSVFDVPAFSAEVEANVEEKDAGKLAELPVEEVVEIAETRNSLMDSLQNQLDELGFGVLLDPETGVFSVDASVLFGGDSAELTEQGKQFLKLLTWSYAGVITDKTYDGFVSAVLVEGHTAPLSDSTYESGLPLSQARAEAVLDYMLSDEVGLPADQRAKLKTLAEPVGRSNSMPVLNADGSVNLEACRRVTFRFLINID